MQLFASSGLAAVMGAGLLWAAQSAPLPVHAETALADIVLVQDGDRVAEDLYAIGNRVVVEGVVAGDLVVAAGELQVTGTVDGDVIGVVGRAVVGGDVGGSVRLAAGDLLTDGRIAEDLAVVAGTARSTGRVGRDVLAFGDDVSLRGEVGRSVRGRMNRLRLGADVSGRVDVTVEGSPWCDRLPGLGACRESGLVVEPSARVGGNIAYRSPQEANVSGAAEVDGRLIRRQSAPANVRVRAVARVVSVLWFLAFVVTGLALLAVLGRSAEEAVEAGAFRPFLSILLGVLVLLGLPVLAIAAALTVVGLPIALIVLAVWALLLFAGPVPAVAGAGRRISRRRLGRYGGFLLGSLFWGLLRLVPILGGIVYLLTLLWGAGAWTLGIAGRNRGRLMEDGAAPGRERSDTDQAEV